MDPEANVKLHPVSLHFSSSFLERAMFNKHCLFKVSPIDCPADCQLERGLLEKSQLSSQLVLVNATKKTQPSSQPLVRLDVNSTNNTLVQLVVEGETFTEFCLTRECSEDGSEWHFHYQACGRSVVSSFSRDNFDSRCRSVEDSNTLLKEKFTKVPLCCGINGTLDVDSYTCSNGQELPKEVAACNNNNKNSPTRWPTATGRTSRA